MFDVIALGDATFDTFVVIDDDCPQCRVDPKTNQLCINYADKVTVKKIDQSIGGNATNLAVGVSRLGLTASLVSTLGDDLNGIAIQHELEQAGVDTQFVTLQKHKETRFAIVLNYRSERTILSYHAERRYRFPKLPDASWLYFTSHGKGFESIQKALLTYKKKHPATRLAVNPGSYQMRYGIKNMRALLPHTDVLFVNREEAQKLVGGRLNTKACLSALRKRGVTTVCITDGLRGSYAADASGVYSMGSYPVTPLAKTGAGDAFASGCLAALHLGHPLPVVLQWGTANASGVIQKVGAQHGLLTRKGITKTIQRYAHITPKQV